MFIEGTKNVSPFRQMLHDFINLNLEKTNLQQHKNLQRAIEVFTKTQECWASAIEVLSNQKDPNVLTLCSSILKNKLQFDFSQLNQETFQQVHLQILKIIEEHAKPSTALRTNLSVCIAFIYIHKFHEIGELLPYLSKCFSNVQNRNYIYTVLQVLPQEVDNDQLVVEEEKRQKIREYLKTIQKLILIELNNVGPSAWQTKQIKPRTLLKCFSNWIQLQQDKEIIKSLPQHFILNKAFQGLEDSDISEECTNAIKQVIRSIQNPKDNPELYRYLAQRIIEFFSIINKRIQDQMFMCEDYVYILCTFGRTSREQFIDNPSPDYKAFIDNMIIITHQPQLQCSASFIKFWQKFLYSIVSKKQSCTYYKEQLKKLYLCYSAITSYSLFQCQQLNEKHASELQKINGNFANKVQDRDAVQEIYALLAQALSPEECLTLSMDAINSLKIDKQYFWPNLQSHLNALKQVIDQLVQPLPILDQLVQKMLEITSPYVIVQKTFIRILSSCSMVYSTNAEVALRIFQYLTKELNNSYTSTTASRAFQNVCTNNTEFVLSNINSFMDILSKFKDNDKILKGIMKALSNDNSKLIAYAPSIFLLYMNELSTKSIIKEAKQVLQKFVIIFQEITKQNPSPYSEVVSQCFAEIWKIMKPILQKQCNNPEEQSLLQKCAKVIKYALRCLKSYFFPFMDDIYTTVLESYRKYPVSSYVYLIEVLVTVFSCYPQFIQPISLLFQTTCEITFYHLEKLNDIEQNASLAQDFFGMITRFMRFLPQIINNCKHFQRILQLTELSRTIERNEITRTIYAFLEDLYMQFWDIEFIKQYMQKQKPKDSLITERTQQMLQSREKIRQKLLNFSVSLIKNVIEHLQDGPSSSVRNCIVDTLLAEIKAFPKENGQVWHQSLQLIPDDILTSFQKTKLLQVISVLSESNLQYMQSLIHLMTKRYVHRLIRSPIN